MFGMCNKEHKRCLFIVSKIEGPPSSLIMYFEQAVKPFLV